MLNRYIDYNKRNCVEYVFFTYSAVVALDTPTMYQWLITIENRKLAYLQASSSQDINILKNIFKYAYSFIEANFSKLLLTKAISLNKLFLVYYKLLDYLNQNIPL